MQLLFSVTRFESRVPVGLLNSLTFSISARSPRPPPGPGEPRLSGALSARHPPQLLHNARQVVVSPAVRDEVLPIDPNKPAPYKLGARRFGHGLHRLTGLLPRFETAIEMGA